MITLHYNGTTLQVQEDDSSYRYKAIMGDNSVTLKFSLDVAIDFPVGTYIVFDNTTYTLTSPENWNRRGNENIEYTMLLEGVQSSLKKYKLRNQQDGRLKFSMNATPAEFLQLIVDNLNQSGREGGWTGTCNLTAENKTIDFNHVFLSNALSSIAEAFETEYEITDLKVIKLGKVEYNKSNPLPLAYGKGNGFKPGTGRANASDSRPVEILYVQGGERNIDASTYGSRELHLPKNGILNYEGVDYQADANGLYIKKANVAPVYGNEDSFDGSEVYPKRVGEVSSVIVVNATKHFYDFTDNTIPSSLDYNDYLITGETMTVIFQTGMLAGKEFEVSKYTHSSRRFEIVPQDIDGVTMPDNTWQPAAGDKYAIFGCTLPAEYINDSQTQTGAEWDLFREAARHLHDNADFKFSFRGELQGKWARSNWSTGLEVGTKLVIGGYIRFTDTQFAPAGVDIRIVGVKTFLCDPYAPTIEISNSIASPASVSSDLRKPEAQDVKIEDSYRGAISFVKRRWRDTNETMEMLEDAILQNFTSRISPIAVQTMQLLVGDESLQFVFVDANGAQIDYGPVWDANAKTLTCAATRLKHMTLGIDSLSPTHPAADYKIWDIPHYASIALTDAEQKYYLYAKCPTDTAQAGTFVLAQNAIGMNDVAGYYHFLVGVLNSEYDGDRSFAPLFGFTEILPGRVTADRIVSTDGLNFINLVGNSLHLGDASNYIDWNNEAAGTLIASNATIKNALKVLGEALIAGFYFTDHLIKSTMQVTQGSQTYPSFYLDGENGVIILRSAYSGGEHSEDKNEGSTMRLDAQDGYIESRNGNGVAYVSASGIFSNNPKTNGVSSITGLERLGAIVGLGIGKNVNRPFLETDEDDALVAGFYGDASNTGDAFAYGGYFRNLKVCGFIGKLAYVTDTASSSPVTLPSLVTNVVCLTNSGTRGNIYLPNDGIDGKVVWVKQSGAGTARVYPQSGQHLMEFSSEINYIDATSGQEMRFVFTRINVSGTTMEMWVVTKY